MNPGMGIPRPPQDLWDGPPPDDLTYRIWARAWLQGVEDAIEDETMAEFNDSELQKCYDRGRMDGVAYAAGKEELDSTPGAKKGREAAAQGLGPVGPEEDVSEGYRALLADISGPPTRSERLKAWIHRNHPYLLFMTGVSQTCAVWAIAYALSRGLRASAERRRELR